MSDLFSTLGYFNLIQALLENGWSFSKFANLTSPKSKEIFLRHDVDAELYLLDPFLDIEDQKDIRATYFLMTESPFYNLASPEGRRIVKRISASGHSIGLHFFGELYSHLPQSMLESEIQEQAMFLADCTGRSVDVFSFHQPTQAMLQMNLEIPNLINTYHKELMQMLTYVSDTNMSWKPTSPLSLVHEVVDRIQLLVHPLWWITSGTTPADRWRHVLSAIARIQAQHLLARERTLFDVSIDQLVIN